LFFSIPSPNQFATVFFSLIMDDNSAYISSHTPIDPNQLVMLENLLQVWMLEMKKAIQQQLAIQKASCA